MILFAGIPSEEPLALAIAAAQARGVPHVALYQRHAPFIDMSLDVRDGVVTGALWLWERCLPLTDVTGVYARVVDGADLPETRSRVGGPPHIAERCAFLHTVLNDWLEIADCPVLNRAAAMASNASKPYQLQRIAAAGFAVPDTLVTDDPVALRYFARAHRRVIYKSTSGVRSIVIELSPDRSDAALARLHHLPTQFQQYVDGTNVRVHVVGTEVFATEIRTNAIDYRYAHRVGADVAMSAITLPAAIADKCVDLSQRLDLPFCGIDLKRTEDGEWYCFEVNPSPAYSYYQEHTGQDIADAVVRYLSTGAS
jgi:glutathione synthase/RimK-type ligase-like ATP-grasp enzyme